MFAKPPAPTEPTKIQYVTKRSGEIQPINIQEIKARLQKLSFGLDHNFVNIDAIVQKVIQGMYDKVPTTVLDNLAAETSAYMNILHPHYSSLAARIVVDNLHKETKSRFSETISDLYHYVDMSGRNASLISKDVYEVVMKHADAIEKVISYERDFNYDFFGFKTLERSYLLKINGKIAERPQDMLMRVSIGIHKEDIESAFETYNLMSDKWFTHATPTLFNSGTPNPQMSSCFLLTMKDDSLDGIYDTLKQCALISKSAGGIGLATSIIRAKDSYIRGTNGVSNGLIPMLRVFNDTARYVDQGGGKRKGSFAIYLEPWHADVYEFLELKKNHGKEEQRARDLFFALWIPDLFMERVEADADWTLMCPNECPGLADVWGDEFVQLYTKYEQEKRGRKVVKARNLFFEMIESQIETGVPYMLYKDACNRKSNQQNLGTIRSSNLCTEIVEYTSKDEVAVCNLASINLARFVLPTGEFDYEKLMQVTEIATKNLNKIIDLNYYPIEEARNSNLRHRPIGLGVQGLADAYFKMRLSFESDEAMKVNEKIFETIYYAACKASMELSKTLGPYSSFQGSPASKGILQFDMWNKVPENGYNWTDLKQDIVKFGMRNSLLIAPMPTASTSQILGNNESFEPYTSNLYTRRVLSGEFVCINGHLVKDLIEMNLWTPSMRNKLIAFGGSVQNITEIPNHLKDLYKTVWEIPQKRIIDLAVSRAPFIDQSQSLNIHLAEPNFSKMSSMHFYSWKAGLKTGMYYLRSRPAADAIKFTLDVESLVKEGIQKEKENEAVMEAKAKLDKENEILEPPLVKKVKTENNSKKKWVCGEDVCTSCGS